MFLPLSQLKIVKKKCGNKPIYCTKNHKGLQIQRLIGSAVAGFNKARTITKASATDLDTRQDD